MTSPLWSRRTGKKDTSLGNVQSGVLDRLRLNVIDLRGFLHVFVPAAVAMEVTGAQ